MKSFINFCLILIGLAGAAVFLDGCGGNSSPNVVSITVLPSSATVIASQPQTFTATVTGPSSTTTVTNWPCTYSYTPPATQTTPNPKAVTGSCTSGGTITGVTGKIGSWIISTANSSNVLTYTAPDLADFPNPVPVLTFTATADADKNKTATATVALDSGIRVSVTPTAATVPVGLATPQTVTFFPSFLNANASGQQFKLVQPNTASSTTLDQTPTPQTPDTCDTLCGTIDNTTGTYTAPSTLPTDTKPAGSKSTSPTTVYVVVWNSADPNHYTVATITLVSATTNPVTFDSIHPDSNHSVPAGGLLQDVFLDAKNLLNTTQIKFVFPGVSAANLTTSSPSEPIDSTRIFTVPISASYCTASASGVTPVVVCDASLMTRIRLNAFELTAPEPDPQHPAWIMITNLPGNTTPKDPACIVVPSSNTSVTAIACPLHILNTSPSIVAAAPDSFPQGTGNGTISFGINGGYFGNTGTNVTLSFDGQASFTQSGSSRKLIGSRDFSQLPPPGLYEVSVASTTTNGTPPLFPTATTNAAIQPSFATAPVPASIPLPSAGASTTLAPSAIAVESVKGYAVITEQASGTLQLVDLRGAAPAPSGAPVLVGSGAQPTDIAIDDQLQVNGGDLAVVVDTGASRLYFFSVSLAGGIAPANVVGGTSNFIPADLNSLLTQTSNTATPFAFGVDPITHLGVVAYAGSTVIGTNLAFIVDVNPSSGRSCFVGTHAPCVIAPVSVVTGPTPRVVLQPGAPLAYVTPGGAIGASSVVNLLQTATSVKILPAASSTTATGAFCQTGFTTIKTVTPHGLNAALSTTVVIAGITSKSGTNFNGTRITTSIIDPYTFQYQQPDCPSAGDQETNTSSSEGTIQYGSPYYSFSTTANVEGAAINPVTRTFAYTDFASFAAQVGFISTLDQTLSSLSLTAGSCNGCTPTPSGGPENGFRFIAFDPFTDTVIAYNPSKNTPSPGLPSTNSISLINPGGPTSGGGTTAAYRIITAIPTTHLGEGSYTPSGATTPVNVFGPMAYDPKSKFVLVGNAGDDTLSYMNLDPGKTFQSIHIQSLQLPDNACTTASSCFAVPIAQPNLLPGPPATQATCSPTDPSSSCMPQAVQVGKDATIRVFGQGFGPSGTNCNTGSNTVTVRLDLSPSNITCTVQADNEIDVSIPKSLLFSPHVYALDVQTAGQTSNAVDLYVVGILNLGAPDPVKLPDGANVCTTTSILPQGPEGVAIDQARHIAVITNYACSSATVINLDITGTLYPGVPYGAVMGSVPVGKQPIGVGIISRLGYAVVANNGDSPTGTATIIDISTPTSPKVVTWTPSGSTTASNAVSVGLAPVGVSIDQDRALALIANSGSNTLSAIDLTVLFPSVTGGHTQGAPVATTIGLSGPPTAVAVDPNRAEAAVTNLQNAGTTAVTGGIDVINLASLPPAKITSASVSSLTVNPTGIVYDPGDPNTSPVVAGVFYVTSTQQNAVYSFNPDTGTSSTIRVGVNPYSVGFNYQTGTLFTINSTSNTSSVIDSQNFKTRDTLSISSQSQFAIDVDQFENTAVIVDQNNNRVLFLALPR